jgi:hypothetical protein
MAVKLGRRIKKLKIREIHQVPGDAEEGQEPDEEVIILFYREPTTGQRNRYLAKGAALAKGLEKGDEEATRKILELQTESAAEILHSQEGIEFEYEEGAEPLALREAMMEYGGDYLRILSRVVFEGQMSTEFEEELGKSVKVSVSS